VFYIDVKGGDVEVEQAFVYLRVSSSNQLDGFGFDRQLDTVKEYCNRNKYKIVEVFKEEAVSGTTDETERPAFKEMMAQILSDGVGAEQSPTYTAFTLEWYLLAARVANAGGEQFPDDVLYRLEKAGEFLRWITDAKGNQPRR